MPFDEFFLETINCLPGFTFVDDNGFTIDRTLGGEDGEDFAFKALCEGTLLTFLLSNIKSPVLKCLCVPDEYAGLYECVDSTSKLYVCNLEFDWVITDVVILLDMIKKYF